MRFAQTVQTLKYIWRTSMSWKGIQKQIVAYLIHSIRWAILGRRSDRISIVIVG